MRSTTFAFVIASVIIQAAAWPVVAADSAKRVGRTSSVTELDDLKENRQDIFVVDRQSDDEAGTPSELAEPLFADDLTAGDVADTRSPASVKSAQAASSDSTTQSSSSLSSTYTHRRRADLQTSLTLDPSEIGPNLAQDGMNSPEQGQVPSLTSTNNFINFCYGQTITNGQQGLLGSCNPVPMGQIPAKWAMPSAKFMYPANGATIKASTTFTIVLALSNLEAGHFASSITNYYAAPQQLNSDGIIMGHSHVVVEALPFLSYTGLSDPSTFVFFKALNEPTVNGVLTATVQGGLPSGSYKVTSINTSTNHAPVLLPVAMHGSTEDVSYFTVT